MKPKNYVVMAFAIFMIFAVGMYNNPFTGITEETDLDIDAEYLTGILTASGIIFGLWGIVFEPEPDKDKQWEYVHIVKGAFFYSIFFLIISVISIMLTAANVYSSLGALLVNTFSFGMNTFFLGITINHFKFRE